jgi:hypothetical protein
MGFPPGESPFSGTRLHQGAEIETSSIAHDPKTIRAKKQAISALFLRSHLLVLSQANLLSVPGESPFSGTRLHQGTEAGHLPLFLAIHKNGNGFPVMD